MKKKIVSLFLTLTMVLAMTIPVFAGSYSSDGYYEGSYYEIVESCTSNSFSCSTFCMDYTTETYVKAYLADGDYVVGSGGPTMGASTASGSTGTAISRVSTTHRVNDHIVRTNTITP